MKHKLADEGEIVVKVDYSKKIIFSVNDLPAEGHVLQIVTIPPKTKQRQHYHNKQTEVFYILEGETIINIDGQDYVAKPGDAFVCSPGDKHYLWNKSNHDFRLVVFKINKDKKSDDTVWEEG